MNTIKQKLAISYKIMETRPFSKDKYFRLVEIVEEAVEFNKCNSREKEA